MDYRTLREDLLPETSELEKQPERRIVKVRLPPLKRLARQAGLSRRALLFLGTLWGVVLVGCLVVGVLLYAEYRPKPPVAAGLPAQTAAEIPSADQPAASQLEPAVASAGQAGPVQPTAQPAGLEATTATPSASGQSLQAAPSATQPAEVVLPPTLPAQPQPGATQPVAEQPAPNRPLPTQPAPVKPSPTSPPPTAAISPPTATLAPPPPAPPPNNIEAEISMEAASQSDDGIRVSVSIYNYGPAGFSLSSADVWVTGENGQYVALQQSTPSLPQAIATGETRAFDFTFPPAPFPNPVLRIFNVEYNLEDFYE